MIAKQKNPIPTHCRLQLDSLIFLVPYLRFFLIQMQDNSEQSSSPLLTQAFPTHTALLHAFFV